MTTTTIAVEWRDARRITDALASHAQDLRAYATNPLIDPADQPRAAAEADHVDALRRRLLADQAAEHEAARCSICGRHHAHEPLETADERAARAEAAAGIRPRTEPEAGR